MKGLDQSKYPIEDIFENQKADNTVRQLLKTFHANLHQEFEKANNVLKSRTHCIGVTYLSRPRKAFIYLNVCQNYLSMRFFTGNNHIEGLNKGIWNKKDDNWGSETFIIQNNQSLDHAVIFAMEAHKIASDWPR
ncbi:MAG: hypothetical protein GX126_00525 [Bacteroidales bacterium]|jgi:hypothetical protein|nr:hypothetical protein [Bacteroidales bacterium]